MLTGYRILEHPADIGIEAYGQSQREAYEEAARGLLSILTSSEIAQKEEKRVVLAAADREHLLVRWLTEILFLYDGEGFLVGDTTITEVSTNELQAIVRGEPLDVSRHVMALDVKAITYHQLRVEENQEGWSVRVFVDI